MTSENQRIAIALQMGAKWRLFFSGYTWLTFKTDCEGFETVNAPADPEKITISNSIPNYAGSLDAAIELCHFLAKQGWWSELQLDDDDGEWTCSLLHSEHEPQHCTSAKLPLAICESFLRALGLWKDEEGA